VCSSLRLPKRQRDKMSHMPLYPEPHSGEWLAALEAFDPAQAAHTRQIIKSAGRKDVCSICGDDPAADFKIVQENLPGNAVASIRLCGDCRAIRSAMHGERYEPLG
jgi:hypothetical protein